MFISLRGILAATTASLIATSAIAADGKIEFTGEITAASCSATAGAGAGITGNKGNTVIAVGLGKVSIDSLKNTGSTPIVSGTPININLDCGNTATGLTTVKVKFDPYSGSGVDDKNNSLLKISPGGASGVGIGIFAPNNTMLNLAAGDSFDSALIVTGADTSAKYTANLNMRAAYVANGEPTIVPGAANGTLPYTLTYQ
ncbi:putative major fimbrial subunit LpfA [Pseudomonas sp. AD21]|uniref:fimbrial protein n=1 Tax=Pseudomonas sp. AD21 TaxID=396378 RepID=UPI000C85F3BB|nr:fimbrial protein [Pseudomonas sp. AD21]PMQ08165.1 putative major fimbrial subunit LpfA [Pseudomonas sp. AD21]